MPGDVTRTVAAYLEKHQEMVVALAIFDLALYEPTKAALDAIRPRLVRGSILAFDELNCAEYPGETQALRKAVEENKVIRWLEDVIVGE